MVERTPEERAALVEATKHLSLAEAAREVGVSPGAMWKWRKGPDFGREMREDPSDERHGSLNGYANYECRCVRCVKAGHDYYVSRKKSS